MKQKAHLTLFTVGLMIAVLPLLHCGKSGEITNKQVAEELLSFLNKQLPGSNLIVTPENRIVEPIEKNRYRVTFKDFTFKTDLPEIVSLITKFMNKDDDFPRLDTFRVEETVMIYDAEKKDIPMYWLKNVGIDYEYPVLPGNNLKAGYEGGTVKRLHINVGKIAIKKATRKIAFSTDALKPYDSTFENVEFGLTVATKQEDLISVNIEIEKIEDIETGQEDPEVSLYFSDKDAPEPNLNNTLKKGLAIFDSTFQANRVKISIEMNGIPWGMGAMENIFFTLFVKPVNFDTGFSCGYGFGIKNLEMSVPFKKEVWFLSNLKDFRLDFCIEPLTPAASLIGLKIIKTIIRSNPIPNNSSMQAILFQALQFQAELMKSNPLARYSIDPFNHYFGNLKATADIRLKGQFPMINPEAKIKVDIFKIDDILRKLREAKVFSPSTLKTISETLEKYTVKKENGDAILTYELKPDHPGKYFLNGNPVMIRR